ncbi:MAG TPA: amino acid adenylation domain-containing protein [Pyrinomonadaceae bacterium]|jgi:amino acid adenylation domain-containing protein/non-ribosomal peptide synthase protein (TIGR01720 family)
MQSEVIEGFMLSPQQRSLWSEQQERQDYRALGAVIIEGDLRKDLLKSAVQAIIDRHEILRTTFQQRPGMTFPLQVVGEEGTQPSWDESNLEDLGLREQEEMVAQIFSREGAHRFTASEGPLVRAALLRLDARRHILSLNISPLCADAATLDNIFAQVAAAYDSLAHGGDLTAEHIQYADFALWQQELTEGEDVEAGLAYWRGLEFEPLLAQPVPFERPLADANAAVSFDSVAVELEPRTVAGLKTAALQYDLPIGSFLLACWQTLIQRLTGQQEIVVGLHSDGRKYEDLRGACGHYAKQLPLVIHFKERSRFTDILAQLKRVSVEAEEWQEYFNLEAVAAGSPQSPFLPLGFEFDEQPSPFSADGLNWTNFKRDVRTSRHKLKLRCTTTADGGLRAALDFDPRYVTRESAARLAAHFSALASDTAAQPTSPIAQLELLDEHARRKLLSEFNQTSAQFGAARCFHEIFAEQAAQTPERIALICEDRQLTYAELERRSNQLARYLRGRGVGRETIVAIFGEREVELIVALLATLKAGAALVAFDPKYPKERLAGLVEDARPKVVLTQARLLEQLPAAAETVLLDADWPQIALESAEAVESVATPDNLAYVIYTSGSTGKPKGVTVEHRQLFNYLRAAQERLDLPPQAAYATVSTLAADLGHTMIFPALASGGTLHVVSHERASDPFELAEYFTRHKIDCLKIVPSHLQALQSYAHPEQLLPAERLVLGGETTRWELIEQLRALRPGCRIFNHYGPTETTVGVIACEVREGDGVEVAATLPLGRPLANTQIYLLDARLAPVPVGVTGDLYVGGAGLARGYLHHPGLTAEKFIPDPFAVAPGARLYRTGDRARYLPDGRIEFLGRADHQVKYHGFRVELNEIRSELNRHPQVSDSVVVIGKGKGGGGEMLVAYYVSRQEIPAAQLREFLSANILEETLPNAFVHLQKLPLTLNGKLDYQALPTVEQSRQKSAPTIVSPRTPAEQILASIWTDLLGVEQISIHDNFFELGGHSLLATQVVSRLREAFRVELPMRDLFEWPTVAGLAARVEEARRAGHSVAVPPIEPTGRDQALPLSFAQQRLWFLNQLEPDNPAYNMFGALQLNGRLDAAALEQSINRIVARHEPVRTTFGVVDGQPVQIIAESLHLPLPLTDLSTLDADARQAEVSRLSDEESKRTFDLAAGPLLRLSLLRLSEEEHVLLVSMHHIISDAWSIAIFTRELAAFYEAAATGRTCELPALRVQYADFAHWQREWLQGENLERELAFWKKQLEGAPPVLELPTDRPRPEVQSFRGARLRQLLPTELLDGLKTLSRSEGSTVFMTLLAAFQVLLQRYTGQQDIVVGTDIAGRNRQELENLIGFFVNHPVLRTSLEGNPSFRELLKRVREVTLDAFAHQDLPFDKLVSALRPDRNLSRMPIFQVLLVLRNTPIEPLQLSGLKLSLLETENLTSKFDVALFMEETAGGLAAVWNYSTDLFDSDTIERMARHFEGLLYSAVAQPDVKLDEFEISGLDTPAARVRPQTASAPVAPRLAPASGGEPQNELEETLVAIWSQLLGAEKIGIHDNFFELGGDSIISIQIIARASQQGIRLTPRQFFLHQTIAELAAVAGTTAAVKAEQGLVVGTVPLTPVQQTFFARNLPEPHSFTQAVLIETGLPLDPSLLEQTVRQLLLHHDALRLRYERDADGWRQTNSGEPSEVPFAQLDFSALPEGELDDAIEAAIEAAQSSIDLSSGALLKVTRIEQGAGRPDLVLLTVHHLAIDVVSWRILIEDLQSVYLQLSEGRRPRLAEKTTSFKRWAERVVEHVGAGGFGEEAGYWLDELRGSGRALPLDFADGQNTLSSARVVTSTLDADETRALLQEVPQAYHTQVNEVLLTALARAFAEWSGNGSLLVEMEGHGREEVFDDVDLSRTVGWFTSLYPVLLETEKKAGAGDELKRFKEKLRSLPNRGLGFGLLRSFGTGDEAARLRERPRPEVGFNYLGQFDLENAEASSFGRVRSSRGASGLMPGARTHLLEVDAKVVAGRLQVDWTYSENLHRRETVEALAGQFERALRALIEHCRSPEAGGFTPSDFPDAELSQAQLDNLFAKINA